MYLRLAFSVAAHLEPEILVLDEVLAVGDISFQQKCMNKMNDLREDGRTILFVSHSMQAIARLCKRVLYLSEGTIQADGPVDQVASNYLGARVKKSAQYEWPPDRAPGNSVVRLSAVRVRTVEGETADVVDIRREVGIEMEFEVLKPGYVLVPNYHLTNEEGVIVFIATDHDPSWRRLTRAVGRYRSTAWIPGNFLSEGTLMVGSAVSTMAPVMTHFFERDVIAFQVVDSLDGDSARGDYMGSMPGVVRPLLTWTTEFQPHTGEPVAPLCMESTL
jgi:lipopolysaccharide transport system ATP-binding protein